MKAWPASPSLSWAGRWEALEGGRACKGALVFPLLRRSACRPCGRRSPAGRVWDAWIVGGDLPEICNLITEVAVLLTLYVALAATDSDRAWQILRRQHGRK